jgi:hypothetical protein
MSGRVFNNSQTFSPMYPEMIQQPPAEESDFAVSLFPILVPSETGGAATTKLATTAQLVTLFDIGLIGNASTISMALVIAANVNALLVGPITIASGGSITLSSGSVLRVV